MGEQSMELLEQNIQHATEDIREVKKRLDRAEGDIGQLKSTVQLVQQSQGHIMENISELKVSFRNFNEKWEEKWQREEVERKKEKEEELRRYQEEKADRAKELRGFAWKVAAGVVIAAIILALNLK